MGDRSGSYSRVRTSEDKVCKKDMCWSVRIVCVLIKLPDVSGPGLGEAGRYKMVSEPSLSVSRARTGVSAEARRWHWTHGRGTWAIGTEIYSLRIIAT